MDIWPEMCFDGGLALIHSTELKQLRGCEFVKGVLLRRESMRVGFVRRSEGAHDTPLRRVGLPLVPVGY